MGLTIKVTEPINLATLQFSEFAHVLWGVLVDINTMEIFPVKQSYDLSIFDRKAMQDSCVCRFGLDDSTLTKWSNQGFSVVYFKRLVVIGQEVYGEVQTHTDFFDAWYRGDIEEEIEILEDYDSINNIEEELEVL